MIAHTGGVGAGWGDTTTGVGSCVQIGIPTMVALVIFSQYLRNVKIRVPGAGPMPIFALFPVLFSIAIMWIISCAPSLFLFLVALM